MIMIIIIMIITFSTKSFDYIKKLFIFARRLRRNKI